MRAKEFIVEYKQYPLEQFQGLNMKLIVDAHELFLYALDDWDNELGHVRMNIGDGEELDPQDLFVKEKARGQGVAKVMYDFLKTHGYEIHRSPDQTDAGAHFWDKNRGQEGNVWEETLDEGLAHPIICVDVQPEYSGMNDGDESAVFPEIINFVNKATGPVLMFVNAEDQGLTGDTVQSVVEYWNDTVCPEEERYIYDRESDDYFENPNCAKIDWNRFQIVDKGYGYLRSWMDHGIEPAVIVATIREMYAQKVHDTRQLQFPPFNKRSTTQSLIMGAIEEMRDDPMSVGWTSVAQLKKFNGAYIVGGGRDECLREVELLMNAFNIKYKRIDSLVY